VDGFAIDFDGLTADATSFEPGPPHSGTHPLDDEMRSSSAIAPMIMTMVRPWGGGIDIG
jgi:hypothetical protein